MKAPFLLRPFRFLDENVSIVSAFFISQLSSSPRIAQRSPRTKNRDVARRSCFARNRIRVSTIDIADCYADSWQADDFVYSGEDSETAEAIVQRHEDLIRIVRNFTLANRFLLTILPAVQKEKGTTCRPTESWLAQADIRATDRCDEFDQKSRSRFASLASVLLMHLDAFPDRKTRRLHDRRSSRKARDQCRRRLIRRAMNDEGLRCVIMMALRNDLPKRMIARRRVEPQLSIFFLRG